jgi:hypothetical protein
MKNGFEKNHKKNVCSLIFLKAGSALAHKRWGRTRVRRKKSKIVVVKPVTQNRLLLHESAKACWKRFLKENKRGEYSPNQ